MAALMCAGIGAGCEYAVSGLPGACYAAAPVTIGCMLCGCALCLPACPLLRGLPLPSPNRCTASLPPQQQQQPARAAGLRDAPRLLPAWIWLFQRALLDTLTQALTPRGCQLMSLQLCTHRSTTPSRQPGASRSLISGPEMPQTRGHLPQPPPSREALAPAQACLAVQMMFQTLAAATAAPARRAARHQRCWTLSTAPWRRSERLSCPSAALRYCCSAASSNTHHPALQCAPTALG